MRAYTRRMASSIEWDLGMATALEAEAIGEPGARRFRIRATAGETTASIWCEKEHVDSLAASIERVLASKRAAQDREQRPPAELVDFPLNATAEFLAGRFALSYDEDADLLTLYATDVERMDGVPTLKVDFGRRVARGFTALAEEALAGGRPTCPLCRQPLEGDSHLCPQSNGHGEEALAEIGPPEF